MLKRKTNIFVTILFTFVAFMLIGTTNVNAGTTEIVTTEQELRDAIDGRVGTNVTGETDTETTYVKLNNNIALNKTLYFYVSTDLTLDLNGYTIEPAAEKASLYIYYGNNRKDMFTNGSLTIKDSSVEKNGTIKSYDPIYIEGYNTDDVDKHFALTIENGNFYANQGNAMFIFRDNTAYGKTNKATYDFKINGGNFTLWGNDKIFLYLETSGTSNNINFNFNLDKLTIKGNNAQLVWASSKDFRVNDIVSTDSIIKLKNSDNSNEATLEDRTVYASKKGALKTKVGFEYNTIEIIKPYDFEVSDVNLTETYGYTDGTSAPISIRNAGDTDARVQVLNVYSVYGTPGEANTESTDFIIEEGNKTSIASGTTDKTWKIKAKPGLSKGTYTATIVVANNVGKQYKSNVTLTVKPRTLNLKVTDINDKITYGDTYTPVPAPLTGANPLNKSDYNVTYATKVGRNYIGNTTTKPTDVGEYKVTITVTNPNYETNTPTATFKIVAKKIEPTVSDIPDQTYTGGQIIPEVSVTYNGTTLTKDVDYVVAPGGMNQEVGEGKITIKPVSGKNYTFDDIEKKFNIVEKTLTDSNVILEPTSFEHTGSEVTPTPVVKDGGRTLTKGTDYELSYANNTSAGEATVTVTGIGNYRDAVTKNFTITAASTTGKARQVIVFADSSITKTYGDSNFTKPVSVTVGDGAITYASSNSDVATVNEATGEVTIKKTGTTTITATASETDNYTGADAQYELTVEKKGLSFTATVNDKEFDYYTDAIVSSIEFSGLVNGETLTKGTDYTVSAMFMNSDESGADNVGNDKDVSVTITLISTDVTSNYSLMNAGNYIAKANITPITMSDDWITLDTTTYVYDGTAKTPNITVSDGMITFTNNTDYTVEYLNNINVGTAKIKVTGKGNYSGEVERDFKITPKSITPTIEDIPAVTYNGSEHTPILVVKCDGITLVEGIDYTVEYTNNLNAGTATASITRISTSNYTFDTTSKTFTINKYVIKDFDIELEYTSTAFNNTAKQPTVIVKDNAIDANNYDVTYANNTNIGTASVTVTINENVNNYTGSATVEFTIVAKEEVTITGFEHYWEFTYDGTPKTSPGRLAVIGDKVPSGEIEVSYAGIDGTTYSGTTAPTNVGKYTVTYKVPESNETYTGTVTFTFIIKKATPTITISNLSQTAGSIVEPTYTVSPAVTDGTVKVEYKLAASGDEAYTETLPTVAGTYSVRVSLTGDKNLNDKSEVATLEIARKTTGGGGGGGSSTTTYTITVEENKNAEITPNGKVKVEKGEDKTFKIKAKEGYEIEDVLVDGKSVGAVNEYTFKDVKAKHTLEVKVKKVEEEPTTPEIKETFKDVKKDDWYFEAVEYVAKKGLMNGTGNDMFSPDATTTRGMIVTILYRLEGEPAVEECSFTDVPSDAYYAKAIAWAEKNGIVLGLGEGKFGPDDEITREQLAAIMYRYSMYKKYDTSVGEDTNILSYNDIQDLAEYAFPAMQYACGDGLISGMGDGNLNPKGNATRAQVATILMRYCEKYME